MIKIPIYCETTNARFESMGDAEECPYSTPDMKNGGYVCSELDHRKCPLNPYLKDLTTLEDAKRHIQKMDKNLKKLSESAKGIEKVLSEFSETKKPGLVPGQDF